MTESKSFKRRVRERMSKTGESYTAARTHVADKRDRTEEARARLAEPDPGRVAEEKLVAATGKGWDEWFAILDRWDAKNHTHIEIARHLADDLGVPMWWTQSITVQYERARGMRVKHQRSDGVYAVSMSRTIGAPVHAVYEAVIDDERRSEWLSDGKMMYRSGTRSRSAHFDWDGGPTRVHVWFVEKDGVKTTVAIEHERLDGAHEVELAKAAWKERLTRLKSFLEG
ncbi:MAG TPA: hypothetical protein VLA82_11295 [Actinomycetota bacterium]|nr:hypothetical protein [Actinomycetota bacterium]